MGHRLADRNQPEPSEDFAQRRRKGDGAVNPGAGRDRWNRTAHGFRRVRRRGGTSKPSRSRSSESISCAWSYASFSFRRFSPRPSTSRSSIDVTVTLGFRPPGRPGLAGRVQNEGNGLTEYLGGDCMSAMSTARTAGRNTEARRLTAQRHEFLGRGRASRWPFWLVPLKSREAPMIGAP
jgi:hypothetical protein